MSSKNKVIIDEDLRVEAQIKRCHAMIYEYFQGQHISIDYRALFNKLEPFPILFQFTHLIAFHKYDWKAALSFVHERRGEIMAYSRGELDEQGRPTAGRPDGEANGADVESSHQRQPLRVGDDGVPVERKKDPS